MASPIAELLIKLGVDEKEVNDAVASTPGKFEKMGSKLSAAGSKLTKGVTVPIVAAGAGLFALAGKQEEAEAKLVSSFDSMSAAGWTTVDELKAQASEFQEATTFGDESILDFQSVLLTFGNVTGDVFTDATRLGLDMSAKLGTDLQSSAIQLGKALNDPVKGVSALSRVGVSFTEDQKEMIKEMANAGDMAGAQAIILGELEKQFGGTAEAMAQTGTGQAKQAMNALGDAGEELGAVVVPMVTKLAGWLKELVARFHALSPEAKEWIVRLGGIAAAVGPVLLVGGKLISSFGQIGKAFGALSKLVSANPWVLLIAATVALVTLIVQNWDKITATLKRVWDWITRTARQVANWFKQAFKQALDFVTGIFLNFTGPGLLIKHFDKIRDAVTRVVGWIRDKFNGAVGFLKGLPGRVSQAVAGLFDTVKSLATGAGTWVRDRFNDVVDFVKGLPGRIASAARGMWDGIVSAFKSAINWVIDAWNRIDISIGPFSIPDWIPVVGGKTWSTGDLVPDVPRLHGGGMYRAPVPGGEGLALLQDREFVSPAGAGLFNGANFVFYGLPSSMAREVGETVGLEVRWATG